MFDERSTPPARPLGGLFCYGCPPALPRIVAALLLLFVLVPPAYADDGTEAGLVVRYGDGHVETYCVELGADGVATGEEVLALAGLDYVMEYGGMGGALCRLGPDGCDFPAESCFCHCTLTSGQPCTYWTYSHLVDGAWQPAGLGASSYEVTAGAVEGWAWGAGEVGQGATPPVLTFEEICQPAVPATVTPERLFSGAEATATPGVTARQAVIAETATPPSPPDAPRTADAPRAAPPPATGGGPAGYWLFGAVVAGLGVGLLLLRGRP